MKPYDLRQISRQRLPLYGVAALGILLLHLKLTFPAGAAFEPARWLSNNGLCGVDVFVLLSGMGLYRSLQARFDLKRFYLRRIARVAVPGALVAAVFSALNGDSSRVFLGRTFFFSFWAGDAGALWFVAFILAMYLIYPAVFVIQRRFPRAAWALFPISAVAAWAVGRLFPGWASACGSAVYRVPAFLLGCLLAPAIHRGARWPWWSPLALLAGYAALSVGNIRGWVVVDYFRLCMSYICLSLAACLLLSRLFARMSARPAGRGVRATLSMVGTVSLEIYMLQSRLGALLVRFGAPPASSLSGACLLTICTLALAFLLRWSLDRWTDRWRAMAESDGGKGDVQ